MASGRPASTNGSPTAWVATSDMRVACRSRIRRFSIRSALAGATLKACRLRSYSHPRSSRGPSHPGRSSAPGYPSRKYVRYRVSSSSRASGRSAQARVLDRSHTGEGRCSTRESIELVPLKQLGSNAHSSKLARSALGGQQQRLGGCSRRWSRVGAATQATPSRAQAVDPGRDVAEDDVHGSLEAWVIKAAGPQEFRQTRRGALHPIAPARGNMHLETGIESRDHVLEEIDEAPAGIGRGLHEVKSAGADHDMLLPVIGAEHSRQPVPVDEDIERRGGGAPLSPGREPP